MNAEVFLAMICGLGLFLYGMKLMSEGLEKVAGAKLRSILEMFTKNRFVGMLVGIVFTAIVQSSSATTVLVVSFVNAGLMNLFQAAGVIMGANIGTTVTSQLIAFNLTATAPLFLITGVIMVMFFKKPTIKKLGEVVLGFGILFVGMSAMSGAMETLKQSQEITNLIGSLDSPVLAVVVGFVVTAILQSSSATVGIVLLLASQGLIPLVICFYIILGCNMGSCVSALLASLGGKKEAKRAAWIHFIINIVGSFIIMIIMIFFKDVILSFITGLTGNMADEFVNGVNAKIARDVANTHTLIKVFEVALLFPFSNLIVKLTYLIIPGKDEKEDDKKLQYIGEHLVYTPTAAVPKAIKEIERMGHIAVSNLEKSMEALLTNNVDLAKEVYDVEQNINYLNKEITEYLVKVNQLSIPIGDKETLANLFHIVNDIERIGDHAENMADYAIEITNSNISISKQGKEEIKEMLNLTKTILNNSLDTFTNKNKDSFDEILSLENKLDNKERELQKNHVLRLTNNQCTPQASTVFADVISNLERVADHGTNITLSMLDYNTKFVVVD